MKKIIVTALAQIERDFNIEILFACESGSRGWGFPSLDSDYDVRFIYRKNREDYLSVFDESDQISVPLSGDLDIMGWDIKKVFKLLYKSNVSPFEWIQSPIVYRDAVFSDVFKELLPQFYDAKIHMHHYLGIVRGKLEVIADGKISLKSFFYILRSLLSAKWSMVNAKFAPMEFQHIAHLLPDHLRKQTEELQLLKAGKDEQFRFELPADFSEFIEEELAMIRYYSKGLGAGTRDKKLPNKLFKEIIKNDGYTIFTRS